MNKEEHRKFVEKLNPYPFYKTNSSENSNSKVYVKIVKTPGLGLWNSDGEKNKDEENCNEDETIHISLINDDMLNYDEFYFERDDSPTVNNEYSFRPYFYEFYSDLGLIDNKEAISFLDENQGKLLVGEIHGKEEKNNQEGHSDEGAFTIKGTVFFSASPFKTKSRYLTITDKAAPADINDRYTKTYNTTTSVVSQGTSRYTDMCNILDRHMGSSDFYTRIYNVGQGNCVYVYSDKSRILFDIGYTKSPNSLDWRNFHIKKSKHSIGGMKPYLNILSHWDMDHIIGVEFAKDDMFNHPWIAPDLNELGTKSISAERLARYLSWKNQLYLVGAGFLDNLVHDGTGFKLWRGIGGNNTGNPNHGLNKANNYGLIIELIGTNRMLLTGDCEYSMLPSAMGFSSTRYNYLMVPHHCSRMPLIPLAATTPGSDDYAIVSAGDNSYRPRHPYDAHLNELKKEYTVKQTVGNWYLEIPSINSGNICNEVK